MKLYTEEEVKRATKIAQKCDHDCGGVYFYCTENEVLEELTPIELPSVEEIQKMAIERFPISMEAFGGEKIDGNEYFRSIFIQGIECLRDKLQGGNK
jgi:hypothetical protein